MNFDLTTKEGSKKAAAWLNSNKGAVGTYVAAAFLGKAVFASPAGLLGFAAYKLGKAALPSSEANKKQAKAAEELIETGKRNGVDKMKIALSHQAGAHFESNVEGVKIKMGIGSDEKTHINVKYK